VKPLTVLIVDDEPLARSRIARLLNQRDDVECVGESRNGAEAITDLGALRPDLVFLDIQMPDMDGFEVLAQLPADDRPSVIFVTAYDQYALKAFEVHALDYLLKPFDNSRFSATVDRAVKRTQLRETDTFQSRLMDLMTDFQQSRRNFLTTLSVKKAGGLVVVRLDDVHYLETAGNYVALQTSAGEHLHRIAMNTLADDLDPAQFLRIHRTAVVNVNHVVRIQYLNNNQYRIEMMGGVKLTSGRTYKDAIAKHLAG
jgi:two-component system LytT family response regulator